MWPICLGLNGFVSSEKVFGLNFQLEEILSHARDLGYDGIELFPFHQSYPGKAHEQRTLRQFYQGYGLAIPALQSACQGHAASPVKRERDAYIESLKAMLELAHNVGAGVVGVWSGMPIPGMAPKEQVQWCVDTYQQCAQLAQKADITLALEPEPVQVIDSLEDLLKVLDGVKLPCFTAIFDLSHVNVLSRGHPLDFLKSIHGRIGHVHFTDNDGEVLLSNVEGASHTSKHLAVGDGDMDLVAIINAFRQISYSGWMQVDVWENPDPYLASRKGKEFLDSIKLGG